MLTLPFFKINTQNATQDVEFFHHQSLRFLSFPKFLSCCSFMLVEIVNIFDKQQVAHVTQFMIKDGYVAITSEEEVNVYNLRSKKLCYETPYKNVMVIEDSESSKENGIRVLIQLATDVQCNRYVIFQKLVFFNFSREETLYKFISNSGNNGTPYSVGFGAKNLCLRTDKKSIPKNYFSNENYDYGGFAYRYL